jgi:hypothetical protein
MTREGKKVTIRVGNQYYDYLADKQEDQPPTQPETGTIQQKGVYHTYIDGKKIRSFTVDKQGNEKDLE